MHQSRLQAEHLHLDGSRGLERRLRQMLRARWLREMTVVAIEMVTMVTEAARLAAAALTRNESKQCGWLEKVSICTGVKENESGTHQCCLGHPSDIQTVCMNSLHSDVDMEESKLHL